MEKKLGQHKMYVASHPEATFLELHKDDFDARVPIVLDGTPEAAEESLLMLAIARGVDATGLDKRRYVDVLATLKDLAALVHWDKMKAKRVLLRLEDQHRVFLRKEPRRVFKSKTVIQVGVGNHRCLFAPVLSPEYLFNESCGPSGAHRKASATSAARYATEWRSILPEFQSASLKPSGAAYSTTHARSQGEDVAASSLKTWRRLLNILKR